MDQAPNTPEQWDRTWGKTVSLEEDRQRLAAAERELRWRRLRRILYARWESLSGLRAVEIGAGTGTYSAMLAKQGADVSVIDYSDKALERSREFFERNALKAAHIPANALALPETLREAFDLSLSFGLAEHFLADEREKVLWAHFELLKPGGLAVISVPNAWNPPYRLYKFAAERAGKWGVGEEYPFSRAELARFCKRRGIRDYAFIGDSLIGSIDYFLLRPAAKRLGWGKPGAPRVEIPTPLDAFASYSIVLCAAKPE